jgi:predicted N-formylglutamate amidohydrolase
VDAAHLLATDEPVPFAFENPHDKSTVVIGCEHGGHRIPAALDSLGLAEEHRFAHFIWDIGALELARALSGILDATLVHQPYSRMICDCNRRPDVDGFIPAHGEGIPVPANLSLHPAERTRRQAEIWEPFHDGIAGLLDQRLEAGRKTILVTIHSFTPVFDGEPRHWHAGVLHDRDQELSPLLFDLLEARHGAVIGQNQPYSMSRDSDYTIPVHGEDRELPCTEIEVRNDLIAHPQGISSWASTLAETLRTACKGIGESL